MSLPEHVIASNVHGSYCVPTSSQSRPAASTVLAGKVWEHKTIAYMTAHCGDGDIVHAGTYFGDFLPGLSRALHAKAQLWAFEPSSENHACARRTLELNAIANTTLMHAGLGARAETKILCVGRPKDPSMGGVSRVVKFRKAGYTHEDARIVALDDVVPPDRKVSIIQLDVEGYEQPALTGALQTIARCKPILILEFLPKDSAWFQRTILDLGYRENGKVHANTIFAIAQ